MPATNTSMTHRSRFAALVCALALGVAIVAGVSAPAHAQVQTATLSGFVDDQTGAIIPGAEVTLTNQLNKSERKAISNSAGIFVFASVPTGTYTVKITYKGFDTFIERGIELHPADKRELTDIKMKIGAIEQSVTVQAHTNAIEATGERSALITAEDIKRLPVEGRDATELIKTLPGFAQTAGSGADNLGPDPGLVGGQTGNYTANGASAEGISIISDGVNITDPGNGAGSDQVINMDTVAELKVQTSNFGADSAKGPIVINAVGKSGGTEYHGSIYTYARTYQLNTQDWFSKHEGDAKPSDHYVYPGFNIGGPVRIPGTDFNHSKKLTFFTSFEAYDQRNVYAYGSAESATINALLPTANMRQGDFSQNELTNYFGIRPDVNTNCNLNGTSVLVHYVNICNVPSGPTVPIAADGGATLPIIQGQIPQAAFDPNTNAIINGLMPLPNRTPFYSNVSNSPTGEQVSVYNYQHVNLANNDSYQASIKFDYAATDSTKFSVHYNFQHSNGRNPQQIFYSPQQPFGEINDPQGILNNDFSHTAGITMTQTLSASMTNEAYIGINLNFGGNAKPSATAGLGSTIGYTAQGIFPHANLQYPQLNDYGYDGLPLALFPDFSSKIFQHKFTPAIGDNFTKVYKSHTAKVGAYIERDTNNQTDLNVSSNGQLMQYYVGPNNGPGSITEPAPSGMSGRQLATPGNYLASFFEGEIQAYGQNNFQTNSDLYYWTLAFYATDSWKVNKQLTVNYGVRVEHLGPWQDAHGQGFAVFVPSLYAAQTTITGGDTVKSTVTNPGFTWHGINKSIPNSGTGSTFLFYSPRFDMAYDMYGNGKTVFRGGFGAYRSHDAWNDINQEQATAQGQTYSELGGGGLLLSDVPTLAAQGLGSVQAGAAASGIQNDAFGVQQGDHDQPLTWTYSFTLSQQISNDTLFEASYQGSQTNHLYTQYEQGASGDLENIDALPIGTLYHPDPLTGEVNSPQGYSAEGHVNDFRTYPFYSQVNIARHILYSNYNALQTSLRKTNGRAQYSVNYTWSKNLGVLGSYGTGNVIDSTNIRPNYGPLAQDRSHVVNATYSLYSGDWKHGSKFVRTLLNGWDAAGIVNLQSGANIQRALGSSLGLGGQYNVATANLNYTPISNLNFLGTPDVVLQPNLTCDPRSNLNKPHEYLNVTCFAVPAYGVNGPAQIPYIHAPAYFDTDLRITKEFHVGAKNGLQFSGQATNLPNRANYSFSSKFPSEQTLYFSGQTLASATASPDFGQAQFRFGRRVIELSAKYSF